MPLAPGVRFGPYEIVAPAGAGGMGEVYRARDTRLDRTVAIKVLPAEFSGDPLLRERFDREARAIASLNHPHICALYDVGADAATQFLVLEFLEGQTLAERLLAGPVAVNEALRIAIQICDALGKAHRAGIVHRDLKPANVMLTKAGAKLLDFGLAKAAAPVVSASGLSMMPTTPHGVTAQGTILGTFQYMAPEQIEGLDADARSDIFTFGALLFEMLTGRKAFDGKTRASLLGAILKDDPPRLSTVQPIAPRALDRIVATCLAKEADDRWQSARDLMRELRWVADGGAALDADRTAPAADGQARIRARGWTLAATASLVALAVLVTLLWRGGARETLSPVFTSIDLPPDYVLGEDDFLAPLPTRTPMLFTPDGRSLIIQASRAGKPQLFLRSLDRPDARPIAGTEDARVPFISPDGKWIGFVAANELRKVPIDGGTATTICPFRMPLGPVGASWGAHDVILFGDWTSGRIMRVPAGGGTPAPVTAPPGPRRGHGAPLFLPDGNRFLFSDVSVLDAGDAALMVQTLDKSDARLVVAQASDARLLPSGRLAFMRLGTLMTTAFDPARAEPIGEAVAALSGVMQSGLRARAGANNTGAGMFAVSNLGALAVVRGPVTGGEENRLVWATRSGPFSSAEPESGAPAGARLYSRISPDRTRAVVTVLTPLRFESWFADWKRNVWTRCSDCQHDGLALHVWSPEGRRLLLSQKDTLVKHALDGSTKDQILLREPDRLLQPAAWLTEHQIVYTSAPSSTPGTGIVEIKLMNAGETVGRPLVPLGQGRDPAVSPDGRWLAYTSLETNQTSVVVQALSGPGARIAVSPVGGANPVWSSDGRTLYYLQAVSTRGDTAAMSVDVAATNGGLTVGTLRELFRVPESQIGTPRAYDVMDGPRFLFRDRSTAKRAPVTRMDLVLNWTATLPK